MVHPGVVLILVTADAGVRGEVVDGRVRQAGGSRPAPQASHYFGGGIDAAIGDGIARKGRAGDHLSARGIGAAGGVAQATAGGERIIHRNHGAAAVAEVGEVAGAHGVRRHGEDIGLALAQTEAFVGAEEEGFVLADGSADVGAELILGERGTPDAGPVIEEGVGVEGAVAQILVGTAVEAIRAGLSRKIDHATS